MCFAPACPAIKKMLAVNSRNPIDQSQQAGTVNNTVNNSTVNNNTVNNNTVNNTIIIVANGQSLEGVPIEHYIKMHASKGTHRSLLRMMADEPSSLDDLQEPFDRMVQEVYDARALEHSEDCKDNVANGTKCYHSPAGLEYAAMLHACQTDAVLNDLLMSSTTPGKIYLAHRPSLERLHRQDRLTMDISIVHQAHFFKKEALHRLVENSTVRHLIFTEAIPSHRRAKFEPSIDRARYVKYADELFAKVREFDDRHNRAVSTAATKRRLDRRLGR